MFKVSNNWPWTHKAAGVAAYIILLILLVAGCSRSGVWEDDPANWEKVFRFKQPDDVVVTHSWYWKSPHFFFEFEYFFKLKHNDRFLKALFDQNELKKVIKSEDKEDLMTFFNEKPPWFVPKPIELYEIWIRNAHELDNFKIFIDMETGEIFITDYAV